MKKRVCSIMAVAAVAALSAVTMSGCGKSAEKADIDRERKTYAGVSFEIRRSFHC